MVVVLVCIVIMVLLFMVEVDIFGIVEGGSYDFWCIVFYLCIIVFVLIGFNVISVFVVGIVSVCVVGLL